MNEQAIGLLGRMLGQAPRIGTVILVMALTPAICEELAFRGFILSGLRHGGRKWQAIVISSIFFGLAHGFLQQSLVAVALGLLLGYLAVQTSSLLPCVVFHFVHNSLALLAARFAETAWDGWPPVHWLVQRAGDQYTYRWPVVASSVILGCLALAWFAKRGQVHLLKTDRPCGALGSRQELLA